MDTNEPILKNEPTDAERIVKTALRTAWWFCVVASLVCVLAVTLFPYTSMRFYFDAGLKTKTLESAEKVISRAKPGDLYYAGKDVPEFDSKFADALYMAANLSAGFMDEAAEKYGTGHKKTVQSAKKAFRYADMYLPPMDSGSDEYAVLRAGRNDVADKAQRDSASKSRHPAISFENTVRESRVRALILSDEYEKLSLYLRGGAARLSTADPETYGVWLVELNAAIRTELDFGGRFGIFYADGNPTAMLTGLFDRAESFKSFVEDYPAQAAAQCLKRAQWALALSELSSNVSAAIEALQSRALENAELAALRAQWDDYSLREWYGEILADYMTKA